MELFFFVIYIIVILGERALPRASMARWARRESEHSSIREWLRTIHPDLEMYADNFQKMGYNPDFLRKTDTLNLHEQFFTV